MSVLKILILEAVGLQIRPSRDYMPMTREANKNNDIASGYSMAADEREER